LFPGGAAGGAPTAAPAATPAPGAPGAAPAATAAPGALVPAWAQGLLDAGLVTHDPALARTQMMQNPIFQSMPAAQQQALIGQSIARQSDSAMGRTASPASVGQAMQQLFPGGAAGGTPDAAPAATPAPGALDLPGPPPTTPGELMIRQWAQRRGDELRDVVEERDNEQEREDIERALNASMAPGVAPAPGAVPSAAAGPMDPYERFATQLADLASMGFPDAPSNVQALEMANGDINQAMNFLLG